METHPITVSRSSMETHPSDALTMALETRAWRMALDDILNAAQAEVDHGYMRAFAPEGPLAKSRKMYSYCGATRWGGDRGNWIYATLVKCIITHPGARQAMGHGVWDIEQLGDEKAGDLVEAIFGLAWYWENDWQNDPITHGLEPPPRGLEPFHGRRIYNPILGFEPIQEVREDFEIGVKQVEFLSNELVRVGVPWGEVRQTLVQMVIGAGALPADFSV